MPDVFDPDQYEAEMTRRTGKTQAERRALLDAVIDRHHARWSGKPLPNDRTPRNALDARLAPMAQMVN